LAMLAARERARARGLGMNAPGKVVVPHTVHPAFDKAAHVLGLELVKVPAGSDGRACPDRLARAIDGHTIMVAASAPCWPWGLIDPIEAVGRLAQQHDLYFHVDACVGGMFLPFVPHRDRLPAWDFRAEGVSSISVDLHKYGYTPKGLSVLLYREPALRRHQYFTTTDWPGGLFATPALAGTRSAATLAAGWAVMQHLGRRGYERLAADVMAATERLRRALEAGGKLRVVGAPDMSIVAVTSDELDLFELADELALRGWVVGRQQPPTSLHFILNPLHVPVIDQFAEDLDAALHTLLHPPAGKKLRHLATRLSARLFGRLPAPMQDRLFHWAQHYVKATPGGRQAPMYGMMGSLKANEQVEKVLSDYLDRMFAIDCTPSGKM
ncbi:MAG: aspartate aminotransferase family protein, partial [Bacteroidetes bacterium]